MMRPRVTVSRKRLRIYRGITLMHAAPSGGPILLGEASWRTVNGVLVNTPWGHAVWAFRRHGVVVR